MNHSQDRISRLIKSKEVQSASKGEYNTMNEYTELKLEKIESLYHKLSVNKTFKKSPFNLLYDSDRIAFVAELVESQERYERDQKMIEQNEKLISEINNVYHKLHY